MAITREKVLSALSCVVEPESGRDLLRLNMVKGLRVSGSRVSFTIVLKNPGAPFAARVADLCKEAISKAVGEEVAIDIEIDNEMISLGAEIDSEGGRGQSSSQPEGVVNFIAVASGKGGVGKSTVASNLAVALAQKGYDVGLVDTDMYGPSIPMMFGIEGEKPRVNDRRKIVPLERHGVRLLSMGMMVDPAKAVIWRGPMVSNAVRQFLGEAEWGELDYLILDLPPGTGDIQLTIVQTVALTGAIIVSTPQKVALADARKGVSMFENVSVPVLGIVENMAYFTPPDLPDRKYFLFGERGARRLAEELGVALLAEIPIEQAVRETGDQGEPIVASHQESLSARAMQQLADSVVEQVIIRNAEMEPTQKVEILYR